MFRQRKHKIQKIMKKSNLFRGMFPILAVGVMALAGTSLTSCSRSSDDEQVVPQKPSVSVQDIVGTWKLTKYEQKDTDGVYQTAPLYVLIMFMDRIKNINIIVMLLLVIQMHLCLKEHMK